MDVIRKEMNKRNVFKSENTKRKQKNSNNKSN